MASSENAARLKDLDNLRNVAVLLLVVFHTARLFDTEGWHIKDSGAPYFAADLVIRVMNQWHMPVLFLLAGMASWLALSRRGVGTFLGERTLRLFVPLVVGMLLIIPPQVYVERISHGAPNRYSPIDFSGSYIEFMGRWFECCYPQANLSYHHLWFLLYLFAYSIVLAPLCFFLARGAGRDTGRHLSERLGSTAGLVLLAMPIAVVEILLRPSFRSTHGFIDDWANHAHYALLVLLGFLLMASDRGAKTAERRRWLLAVLGLSATAVWLGPFVLGASPWPRPLALAARALGEWWWLMAFLGFATHWLRRDLPGVTAFSRYAMPFYVFHQTVIVLLGYALKDWQGAALVKFAMVAILATGISLGLCWLADRTIVTRWVFGMKGARRDGRRAVGTYRPAT